MKSSNRKKLLLIKVMLCLSVVLLGVIVVTSLSNLQKKDAAEKMHSYIKNGGSEISTAGKRFVRAEVRRSREKEPESETRQIRILMVDDQEENDRVVDRFEKLGCSVKTEASFDINSVNKYDALIIPGGNNITPSVYGQERSQYTSDTDLEKDRTQIEAVEAFADEGKPIFGICRGCQLINVAFGGTLNQGNGEYHEGWHKVRISENSIFYTVFGSEVDAYHYHKQSIGKIADGFVATQWDSEDYSMIEAIEHEALPIYGLQWHCDAIKMHEAGEQACQAFIDVIREYM